jgi:ABC-type uncharacterized transport system substrate-binding protein
MRSPGSPHSEKDSSNWAGLRRNIRIDYRWADDSGRIRPYAEERVRLSPDVILNGNPVVAAVLQQTRTVPIVFVQVADLSSSGFI